MFLKFLNVWRLFKGGVPGFHYDIIISGCATWQPLIRSFDLIIDASKFGHTLKSKSAVAWNATMPASPRANTERLHAPIRPRAISCTPSCG